MGCVWTVAASWHGIDGRDSLRAFVGVGIAYFFIAVLVPIFILRSQGEAGKWTLAGTFYSLVAGSVGCAWRSRCYPRAVLRRHARLCDALVFGFAPIVNTLVTAWMSKTFDQISPIFIGGIVAASLGVGGVLAFKPTAPAHSTTHDSKSEEHPNSKANDKTDSHTQQAQLFSYRYVRTTFIQQPSDPCHQSSCSPPRRAENAPQEPAKQDTTQEAKPVASSNQELPPVVVQPTAPENAPSPKPEPTSPETASPKQLKIHKLPKLTCLSSCRRLLSSQIHPSIPQRPRPASLLQLQLQQPNQ